MALGTDPGQGEARALLTGLALKIPVFPLPEGAAVVDDAVRRNADAIGSDAAVEIPAGGLVLDPRLLLDQVEQALRNGGWPGLGASRRRGRVAGAGVGQRQPRQPSYESRPAELAS